MDEMHEINTAFSFKVKKKKSTETTENHSQFLVF